MQLLAIERQLSAIDPQRHKAILKEEAACVWTFKKQEFIREIWFTRSDTRAIILLECASEEEAKQRLASLPLVRENLITFDVFELRSYDGLDRLISAS